ncbi:MAG: hypothetical protein RL094_485 [Candidatus Parcubacteria bacterium]|jgi:hypothetical protein
MDYSIIKKELLKALSEKIDWIPSELISHVSYKLQWRPQDTGRKDIIMNQALNFLKDEGKVSTAINGTGYVRITELGTQEFRTRWQKFRHHMTHNVYAMIGATISFIGLIISIIALVK